MIYYHKFKIIDESMTKFQAGEGKKEALGISFCCQWICLGYESKNYRSRPPKFDTRSLDYWEDWR